MNKIHKYLFPILRNCAVIIRHQRAWGIMLALLVYVVPAAHSQQFEAEGTVTLSTENNGVTFEKTKHFTVDRNGSQWKIRTTDMDLGKEYESSVLYYEAVCDATNIYYLLQHNTNKAYLYDKPQPGQKLSTALGRVLKGDSPLCLQEDYVLPVWLAYCSSAHLSELKDDKLVAPLFPSRDYYVEPPPKRQQLPAKWKLNSSSFPIDIKWVADGNVTIIGSDGIEKTIKYPPPFDAGFVKASMEVIAETNFGNMNLPQRFVLKVFTPQETNTQLRYSLIGSLKAVRQHREFSRVPILSGSTLITDSRVILGDRPVTYHSKSEWDSEEVIKMKLKNRNLEVGTPEKVGLKKRPIIIMAFIGITAIFIVITKMRSTIRNTKN